MYEEKYEILPVLVQRKKDWAIYNSIIDLTTEERAYRLECIFLQAANNHDDKKAIGYWEFLNRALLDIELHPFLKFEKRIGIYLPQGEKISEARSQAQANCAAC